jgi:hypothetical protein
MRHNPDRGIMPELVRFFGIIVMMFYDNHPPPHFHGRYGAQKRQLSQLNRSRSWMDDCRRVPLAW